MVEIRAFTKWFKVNERVAYYFCRFHMRDSMPNTPVAKRIEVINRCHLRGITFEELERRYGNVKSNKD